MPGYLRLNQQQNPGGYLRPFSREPESSQRTSGQYDPLADPQPGFLGGFLASTVSGIGELFGAPPSETAMEFRNEYPGSGVVSQFIAPLPPYIAAFRASRIPSLAARLEGATSRVASRLGMEDISAAPVRAGMIREAIRFAPLEASRLAVGGMAYGAFDDSYVIDTPLFADIALSTVITGGLGGLGGFFRAGGRRGPQPPTVEGTDMRLAPTHQLDELMNGGTVTGGTSPEDFRVLLRNEILTEQTARGHVTRSPLPYVTRLEGAGADDVAAVNSLFDARARQPTSRGGLDQRLLAEGAESDLRTLNAGEQQAIVTELGFENIDEVARYSMFPRIATAQGPNGARALNGILTRPGWTPVGEGAFLAREPEGAFVLARRLSMGNGRRYGAVRSNDRWFVTKTTDPGRFVPEAAAMGEQTMASWARWRQLWQPGVRNNVFDANTDLMLRAMTPLDYHDLRRMRRGPWITEMTRRLASRAVDTAGGPGTLSTVRSSKTLRDTAEWLYDTFKPTMFLEHQDTRFGRLFGTMRNVVRVADNYAHRIMQGKTVFRGSPSQALRGKNIDFVPGFQGFRPVRQIVDDLSPDEVNMIAHASAGSDLPEKALAELIENGSLSTRAVAAVQELQAINRAMLDEIVLPAIKDLPHMADVKWLEGYIMPRIYRGDFRVEVKSEKGGTVFLAAGHTGSQAQAEARAVIAEAAERGRAWTANESRLRTTLDPDADQLKTLEEQLVRRLASDTDDADIVYKAMRRLAITRATSGKNPTVPATTSTLRRRTGRKGSPDVQTYTHEDFLNAIDGHTRTLLRFSAMQTWKERFGGIAYSWGQNNPTLYANLMRKSQQYLGIEGSITNQLNKVLEPVLGPVLGKKAATKIASATNEVMYNWNLALVNPTFALLNLLTPIQTVAPWIAMMTRAPAHEAAKMMQFVPVFDNAGRARGMASVMHPMKVLREATMLMRNPTDDLKDMLQFAMDDGVLTAQLYEEWVGRSARASLTMREAYQQGGYLAFMRKGATYMAEKSEQYSRMVAFNSGYLIGKNHFGLKGDALYRFSRRATEVTMYNYGTVDRSRIFTGPIGSMFGLFKNWQMHFLGNMINYAGLGWRTGTWSPFLWNMSSALAMGGLGATPLRTLADGIARWNSDAPSSYLWMQENWNDSADTIYFGLPAMLGVSLQASAAIPGTDVRNEVGHLGGFVIIERMKALGKAMGEAWTVQTATGENALRDPNVRDSLLAALAPRIIYRAASAVEGDYVRSMSTGYPMARGVSPAGRLLHGVGMNVTEIERWQVASRELWRDQEARREMVVGLGQAYTDAMLNGDSERMSEILYRAVAMNVPVDSVMQSAQTRFRRETESDLLSRFDRDLQQRYRSALAPQP